MRCSEMHASGQRCVREAGHAGNHRLPEPRHLCHALGCNAVVPPRLLMCLKHWKMVPRKLQRAVWAAYVPGQEVRKNPSGAYLDVQQEAVRAVAVKEGRLDP